MKKATKFIAECGISSASFSFSCAPDLSPSTMRALFPSDDEIKAMRNRARQYKRQIDRAEKTTKQTFSQDIWREQVSTIKYTVLGNLKQDIRVGQEKLTAFQKILDKWSSNKKIDKNKIKYGKQIISKLKVKISKMKELVQLISEGEGIWWNVTLDIENGKQFLI